MNTDRADEHTWLNADAAATYLGDIKPSTLINLARQKKIAHGRFNRQIRFRLDHLKAYADAHIVPAETNPWGMTDQAVNSIRNGRSGRKAS
jgi:hypothetical protein